MKLLRMGSGSLLCYAVATMLVGCASQPVEPPLGVVTYHAAERAEVNLESRSRSQVSGRLEVARFGNGVRVTGVVQGLPRQGAYGIHVTDIGDCSSADATSAGPIFNPHRSAHGKPGMGDQMAGDMDNIVADTRGVARVDQQLIGVSLGGGGYNDIADRAIVVRALPDDHATQPDGAAGPRTACGLITVTLPPALE